MLILVLAVVVNVLIAVCFKVFAQKGVDSMVAIVFNYVVCAVLGSLLCGEIPVAAYGLDTPWVPLTILLGVFFVSGFNITALSIKHTGITTTAAMQRMSLLLSAGFAIIFFAEPLGWIKLVGILLSVIAIILINQSSNHNQGGRTFAFSPFFIYPLFTLIFSGIIESVLYFIKARGLSPDADLQLTTYAFTIAGLIGVIIIGVQYATGRRKFRWQDYLGGLALGLPNFFSIYLILILLQEGYQGSVLFPVLNISVLAASALVGVYLFSEKVSRVNILGLVCALGAILAIMLA